MMAYDDDTQRDTKVSGCRCNGGSVDVGCDELVAVTPVTRRQLRALAFHYIYALDRSDYQDSLAEISQQFLEHFDLKPKDQTFALVLAQGVMDNHERFARELQPMLEHWRVDRLGCCTRLVLYIAMWELEQPQAIASIIINEAVELSKTFSERDAYRFVNGTLDQMKHAYPHSIRNDEAQKMHHSSSAHSSSTSSSSQELDSSSIAVSDAESSE
ncbi:MAG: transcription antitermination factor NusB [bacterium]|jgi:N utilization substance protein B